METETKNRPIHEIRLGSVKSTIWENKSDSRVWHAVNFTKLYRDSKNSWGQSPVFAFGDLLAPSKLADVAHSWILERQSQFAMATNASATDTAENSDETGGVSSKMTTPGNKISAH